MKTALIFATNNSEKLNVHLYPSKKAMMNGIYYLPLKNQTLVKKSTLVEYEENPVETNCKAFTLWKNSERIDFREFSENIEKVVVFHDPEVYEIVSE